MHTVELLEHALSLANRLGYEVRQGWLGGGGGCCELRGRKVLFLDLALAPPEQLDDVLSALCREPEVTALPMPGELRELLKLRKAA